VVERFKRFAGKFSIFADQAGLPTPRWMVVRPGAAPAEIRPRAVADLLGNSTAAAMQSCHVHVKTAGEYYARTLT
jgi:hypothetical protein